MDKQRKKEGKQNVIYAKYADYQY